MKVVMDVIFFKQTRKQIRISLFLLDFRRKKIGSEFG